MQTRSQSRPRRSLRVQNQVQTSSPSDQDANSSSPSRKRARKTPIKIKKMNSPPKLDQLTLDSEPESQSNSQDENSYLCPICYDTMLYPIKLDCKHTFCFLCVKGAFHTTKTCPMCRSNIDKKLIIHPVLDAEISKKSTKKLFKESNELKQSSDISWFYESDRDKHTWWKFDLKTSLEIEKFYQEFLSQKEVNRIFPIIYYDQKKRSKMLKSCKKCGLLACFQCNVDPADTSSIPKLSPKSTADEILAHKHVIFQLNDLILAQARSQNLHIPHDYPNAAGSRSSCKHYNPNDRYQANHAKNCVIQISGQNYVIDFIQRIQYPKFDGLNFRGRIRLIARFDELDFEIDSVRGTAGIGQV